MSRKARRFIRIDLLKNLRNYKGFGKMANGMLRKGFTKLPNGKIVNSKDLL